MANGRGDINAEISVDAKKAVSALNQLIDKLAALEATGPAAAKAIEKVEKNAAGIAAGLSNGTKAVHQQAAAIQALIAQYRALSKEGLKGTGGITNTLQNSVSRSTASQKLEDDLAKQNRAWLTYGRNVVAARTAETRATEQAAAATQRYNAYVRASNGRIQAAEAREISRAKQEVTRQTNEHTAAIRANQQAAFASYAPNIRAAQQSQQALQGMANQRYALYDVATTLGAISGALLGVAAASLKVGISYEKAFAQVERTTGLTGKSLDTLQRQLLDLSTQLPASFEDIAGVAALAGQLGIADASLDDFTETVIKFGATTNVSLDQSATALARLAAMTDAFANDGSDSYKKLASAILQTGINSVATESQIVAITTEIATAGDLAGFSADQIIGLSSAFASLKIAPERARGTMQRVFGQITASVDQGGEALDKFAKVAGVSADYFRAKWENNAQDTFSDFIKGLKAMQDEGTDTNAVLKSLGIGAVRDIQALQALANNYSTYSKALHDSALGYREGNELGRQYAITAETLAARFTQLGSTFRTIINEMQGGALSVLSAAADTFQKVADGLYQISQNKAATAIATVVLAGAALVGVLAAVRAAGALATASLFALQTAETSLAASTGRVTGTYGALGVMLGRTMVGTVRATAAQDAYNASLAAGANRARAMAAGLAGLATAGRGAAGAGALAAKSFLWLGALTAGIAILSSFAQKNQESRQRVDELTASLDQNTGALTQNTLEVARAALEKDGLLKKAQELGINLKTLTAAATGDAGAQRVLQAEYAATQAEAEALSKKIEVLGEDSAQTTGAYVEAARKAASYKAILKAVGGVAKDTSEAQEKFNRLQEAGAGSTREAADSLEDFGGSLQQTVADAGAFINGTLNVQNAVYALGQSLAQNGKVFDLYSNAGRQNFAALQQTISAMVEASGGDATSLTIYLQGLMRSLVNMGVTGADALNMVRTQLAAIGGTGANQPVIDMNALKAATQETTGALNEGFSAGLQKAANSAGKMGKATKEAAKEVRTMSDYVDDLRNIISEAFTFRFEVEIAKDDLAQTWEDIKEGLEEESEKAPLNFNANDFFDKKTYRRAGKDAILTAFRDLKAEAADAAQRVKDSALKIKTAMADMLGLKADKSLLEYQLQMAQKYGDALAEQRIQAELAKNAADQAAAQADLAEAQEEAKNAAQDQNKSLKGNSAAAVNNRNKVRGLLGTYTDYIQSLIDGGASQETINKAIADSAADFRAQGIALGYSGTELDDYVAILTGMKTAYTNASEEQATANKGLNDQAAAARNAREAMRTLTEKQQAYITALINSGASQEEVNTAITNAKTELGKQATQLGLTTTEADTYKDAIDDVKTALNNVPKKLTLSANLTGAKRALAEWKAKKTVNVTAKLKATGATTYNAGYAAGKSYTKGWVAAANKGRRIVYTVDKNVPGGKVYRTVDDNGNYGPKFFNKGGPVGYYARGGGPGHPGKPKGTDTVPAWLTPGEFVVQKSAVQSLGLPFMTALNNMQAPKYLAAGGTTSSSVSLPGVMMVELSPIDRQLLAAAGNVTMTVNGRVLASVTNEANANATTRNVA